LRDNGLKYIDSGEKSGYSGKEINRIVKITLKTKIENDT